MEQTHLNIIQHLDFDDVIKTITKLDGYGSVNFNIKLNNNESYIVKFYDRYEKPIIDAEVEIIGAISDLVHFNLPKAHGPMYQGLDQKDQFVRVSSFVQGDTLTPVTLTDENIHEFTMAAATMVGHLEKLDNVVIRAHQHSWNLRDALMVKPMIDMIKDASDRKLVQHFMSVFEYDVKPVFDRLPHSIIHGDLNEANIIIRDGKFEGFIDFGDISYCPRVCELAILLTYMMMLRPDNAWATARKVMEAWQKILPLHEDEVKRIPSLIATRLCVSVCHSAAKKQSNEATDYILISEKPAWDMLRNWASYNPVFLENSFLSFAGFAPKSISDIHTVIERRKKVAAPSLSLSYDAPIHMSSSLFQYMFDTAGGTYLDAYNNIPHVGHCHPRITEAAWRQMRLLNTNTRYVYDIYAQYVEQLLSHFPDTLDKALLVNSGSEASDLASRIARTVTGRDGMIVMEWGYHGNTQNGINVSSYKFDRKGGKGASPDTLVLPLPKAYKGRHATVEAYVAEAKSLIDDFEAKGNTIAAFITEPISGCGGQVPLMDRYLSLLVPYLRAKGILVIIDEVQTGFGRLGQWFWGFEMHGILPDMVVLGKPIANGHPMGAVITKNEITSAFNNGMEFFSSFGGNPVSCMIGKTVLDIINDEGLQQNAHQVGQYWLDQLRALSMQFPSLGDVRGSGLFIGVECIDDHGHENTSLAQHIKNRLKDRYIFASTDGPLDNVLKMKPPLCFSKDNVDHFVRNMEEILIDNN